MKTTAHARLGSRRPARPHRIGGQPAGVMLPEALEERRMFALPAGYAEADIGTVPAAGSSSYDAGTGTFTVAGSGTGMSGTSDNFHYVYTPVTGDFTYIVSENQGTGPAGVGDSSQMGIALRSSTDATAAADFFSVAPDLEFYEIARGADSGTASATELGFGGTPTWLEISRHGSTVTEKLSYDGDTFYPFTYNTVSISGAADVGMVVSSNGNSSTASDTFDDVSLTIPPSAALTTAPAITAAQVDPYQFTVTYSETTDPVKASTLGDGNLTVTGPGGYSENATLVSTGLNDNDTIEAVYSVPAPTANGTYTVSANASSVADIEGNTLAAGAVGTFSTAIVAAPTVTGLSPTSGTTAGGTLVTITGSSFTGATAVDFGTTSGTDITVVNDTTITADDPAGTGTVDVTVTTPAGTSPTSPADQFTYTAAEADSSISGKVVNALNVTGLAGRTVFIDVNHDDTLDDGDPTAVTSRSGRYAFTGLAAGTYDVDEQLPAGAVNTDPAGGALAVTVGAGQAVTGQDFAELPGTTSSGSNPDLVAGILGTLPTKVIAGSTGTLQVTMTNNGSATATGPVDVSVLLCNGASLVASNTLLATVSSGAFTLGVGQSKTVSVNFTYPTGLPQAKYHLIATVDSSSVLAESNKANNAAISTPIVIIPQFADLSVQALSAANRLKRRHASTAQITVKEGGVLAVNTPFTLSLYESSTQTLGGNAVLLGSMTTPNSTDLAANGGTSIFNLDFTVPGAAVAGNDYLIAVVNGNQSIVESTYTNNTFASPSKVSIS